MKRRKITFSGIFKEIIILFIILVVSIVQGGQVEALSDFYSDSEIKFYDPKACDPGSGNKTTSEEESTETGSGKWTIQDGKPTNISEPFKKFMDKVATRTSYEPIITTTTDGRHSAGSDHYSGNAGDFGSVLNKFGTNNARPGIANTRGDSLAAAALIAAGKDESEAKRIAKAGGLTNINTEIDGKSYRVQVIWKYEGHYDHVHIGIKPLSSAQNNIGSKIADFISENFTPTTAYAKEGDHDEAQDNTVYMLGDSITVRSKEDLRTYFKEKNLGVAKINGDTGRAISKDTVGSDPTGLEAVEADAQYIKEASIVIVALGTNSGGENLDTQIPRLIDKIREINPNVSILWVNTFVRDTDKRKGANEKIQNNAVAKEYNIIDTTSQNIELSDDGVHQSVPEGAKQFASLVATEAQKATNGNSKVNKENLEVNGCCPANQNNTISSSGDLEGDTNAEKAFNFFKTPEGGSLSDAQAAGVVGNMMQESGGGTYNINPIVANGGREIEDPSSVGVAWGIVQWNPGRKVLAAKEKYGVPGKISELKTQLLIVTEEMKGTSPTGVVNMLKNYKKVTTPETAAHYFEEKYEGSGGSALADRKKYAKQAFDDFGDGSTSTSTTSESNTEGTQVCVCEDPLSTSSAPSGNPKDMEDFISGYADAALAAGKKYGIPYDFMLAQISLESGFPLSELASKYNNFGGIKFTGTGKATPPMRTYEDGQGYIMARFRAYDTPQEGIEQQAKFFIDNSLYKAALDYPKNPNRFAEEVAKAGYATDRNYAQKVKNQIKAVQAELTKQGKPLSKDVEPDVAPPGRDRSNDDTTTADCVSNSEGATVLDGFAFPVGGLKKSEVGTNTPLPCNNDSGCHHDGSSAFDIGKGKDGTLVYGGKGLPVYAIEDGEIVQYRPTYQGISGCPTYQLKGKSGWVYWHGHTANTTIKQGSKVKAGQKIAEIGDKKCTGNGSAEHLHIDRGKPKGNMGGRLGQRDESINEVINKLWEALPN